MSRRSDPRARAPLAPMRVGAMQAGRPVIGGHLSQMAWRVAAASVQELPNRVSFFFPVQGTAPSATINALATDFELTGAAGGFIYHAPWMLQDGFDAIDVRGVVTIPWSARGRVSVRVSARTAITSITTVESPYLMLAGRGGAGNNLGTVAPGSWTTGDVVTDLDIDNAVMFATTIVPNRPADDFLVLAFEARSDAESADPGGSIEIPVRLYSLMVSNAITDIED